MKKMMEFQLSLDGTAEQRAKIAAEGKFSPFTAVIDLPDGAVIRRVNTRIFQKEVSGIHPQTKEMGRFIVPEEVVYIWAECYQENVKTAKTFVIIPTDAEIPQYDGSSGANSYLDLPYVGTFLLQAGAIVFHVYGPTR